jgi:LysR family glycine cleavage system transcriptional activator
VRREKNFRERELSRPGTGQRLPPLNTLRGFEAAARLRSFARAAQELCLTQSAVGHQVRQLEAALGQPMFLRQGRELALTDAGRDFLGTVRSALDLLGTGYERLAPYGAVDSLIVSSDAAFGRLWLLPRLGRFRERHPGITLWLDTSATLTDFEHQEVEVVIGGLVAAGANRHEEVLFDERLAPCRRAGVGEPALRLDALHTQTLLHDERRESWFDWLQFAGGTVRHSTGPRFSDPALALEAARDGQGLALASDVLALPWLVSGELETPIDRWLSVASAYRLSFPLHTPAPPGRDAFLQFVREEAAAFAAELARYRAIHS